MHLCLFLQLGRIIPGNFWILFHDAILFTTVGLFGLRSIFPKLKIPRLRISFWSIRKKPRLFLPPRINNNVKSCFASDLEAIREDFLSRTSVSDHVIDRRVRKPANNFFPLFSLFALKSLKPTASLPNEIQSPFASPARNPRCARSSPPPPASLPLSRVDLSPLLPEAETGGRSRPTRARRYAEPDRVPWLPDRPALPARGAQRLLRGVPSHNHRPTARTRDGSAYMWWLSNFTDVHSQCRHLNSIAHVNCGQCRTTLMYPYGAPSVKCAICNYITTTGMNTVAPTPSTMVASNGSSYNASSTSVPKTQPQNVTVVVENPMTVDEKGKLVSNVVVGVTAGSAGKN